MRTRRTLYCSSVWSGSRGDDDVTDPVAFSLILLFLRLCLSSFFILQFIGNSFKLKEKSQYHSRVARHLFLDWQIIDNSQSQQLMNVIICSPYGQNVPGGMCTTWPRLKM